MGLSRADAYDILELPIGADPDSIRTSYKRLAMKWHPDKHSNSTESKKKFHRISIAYKRLLTDNEISSMSVTEMFELFQQVFFPKHTYTNGFASSSDDDSDDSDDDDYYSNKHKSQKQKSAHTNGTHLHLTPEQIEKNAAELITEEEREKKKAEKRRAKKKRRREKKRQEKQQEEEGGSATTAASKSSEGGAAAASQQRRGGRVETNRSSGSEAEGFDPSAAFFTQVKNKKKKGSSPENSATVVPPGGSKQTGGGKAEKKADDVMPEDLDATVLRSRQLAIRGNEMANSGHYQAAIDLFTEAIKLDPKDFRFFGNRSYCFDRMAHYERALKDADKAVHLAAQWPKGYFRKGRALAGLKLYSEAEVSFLQVLKLDRNCEDALQELLRVRTCQLTDMGFSRGQAEAAIRQHNTVQQALDALLAGVGDAWKISTTDGCLAGEVYVSDDEDYNPASAMAPGSLSVQLPIIPHSTLPSVAVAPKGSTRKMDPNNPEGLCALWVGNVLPEVTQAQLQALFSRCGPVTSIRMLPEKYCAFVNFKTKEAAGKAMQTLQGFECAGQKLLIKFPDNPGSGGSVVIRKPEQAATVSNKKSKPEKSRSSENRSRNKTRSAINDDDFWDYYTLRHKR